TATIPAKDLVKNEADASQAGAGNNVNKPADKVLVDPAKGIDEATKKAIEENVKEVNPGSTVVVDENGNATVTTPATGDKPANTATIPAKDLVKNEPTPVPSNDGNTNNSANTNSGANTDNSGNTNSGTNTDDSANTNNGGTTNPAPNNSDSMTPDNSGNTPVPGVTTDDSSNTTPATPSSTVGQAQASTPAQETPVSTLTPNNSGNTGNTVTPSETRPVDKSELARLVEELETRLKDLDGIDSTTLESAKALLTEIKQALNDESLTGFDLRDIVRRMREVIDSLKGVKGDQQNQEKDQMKYDSQTTTEFSYVVMLGSLIALLGLLLFLIARRKKESELKKLVKELSKLEAELDSTSVDAKVLDQAREALAQAVAFLANEKESDHTEDELIEKLKAILAQLR
ncbi:hypothetical protein, partial [Streptococcus pseudopneumoniae]|uniref:hypothetical protein n=1 Tax=Streptococcus pseudopneumoniae TaxID=257758 RepID=UPI002015FD41